MVSQNPGNELAALLELVVSCGTAWQDDRALSYVAEVCSQVTNILRQRVRQESQLLNISDTLLL